MAKEVVQAPVGSLDFLLNKPMTRRNLLRLGCWRLDQRWLDDFCRRSVGETTGEEGKHWLRQEK